MDSICNKCTNKKCEFQSDIPRFKCDFYKPKSVLRCTECLGEISVVEFADKIGTENIISINFISDPHMVGRHYMVFYKE